MKLDKRLWDRWHQGKQLPSRQEAAILSAIKHLESGRRLILTQGQKQWVCTDDGKGYELDRI